MINRREVGFIHFTQDGLSGPPEVRPLSVREPCGCGCDERGGDSRPYLHCINKNGEGFSLRLSPEQAEVIARVTGLPFLRTEKWYDET